MLTVIVEYIDVKGMSKKIVPHTKYIIYTICMMVLVFRNTVKLTFQHI